MGMSSPIRQALAEFPPIDERLVEPETPYEMDDGELVYVSPADPPHAMLQSKLAALLEAHVHGDFRVAVDMLTRTTATSDQAPDASVFPKAPDPVTGRRQLEHLAFEIVSTQSWASATRKGRRLADRGVRRVFAIDLDDERIYEWSRAGDAWTPLEPTSSIEDPALAVPLPLAPLLGAVDSDDAVANALRAKRNPAFLAERAQAQLELLRRLLVVKFAAIPPALEARLASATPAQLEQYAERVLTATTIDAVFAE